MTDLNTLFLDTRPIADMNFAPDVAERVRGILEARGVLVADDINRLGCTGVVAGSADDPDPLETARFLRLGLGGGGVGLPCFVPISRFCLVHNTIGGLEPGQAQHHPEFVDAVSRELTPEEHGRVVLVEAARRAGAKDPEVAADVLAGRKRDVLEVNGAPADDVEEEADVPVVRLGAQSWKCSEHSPTNWACRYCVAQAIVEGPLMTEFMCAVQGAGDPNSDVSVHNATQLDARLVDGTVQSVQVFALTATFTRKLSRD